MNKSDDRLIRISEIVGSDKKGITPRVPVCTSGLYSLIRAGKFPAPVKVGRTSMWWLSDVERFMDSIRRDAA